MRRSVFLYTFFGWRCDIHFGKNGRHCPGIRYKSSLESLQEALASCSETGDGVRTEPRFKEISTTGPVLDSPEKLYSLRVLDGKGQQKVVEIVSQRYGWESRSMFEQRVAMNRLERFWFSRLDLILIWVACVLVKQEKHQIIRSIR